MTPNLSSAAVERLELILPDPMKPSDAAKFLNVSESTVRDSCHRYVAALGHSDVQAMRREIPAHRLGGIEQPNGTFKYGRYIIPRDAFIRWYTTAGLDGELLDQLYGGDAA